MLEPEGTLDAETLARLIAKSLTEPGDNALGAIFSQLSEGAGNMAPHQVWALARAYYHALYDRSSDVVLTLDADRRILAINTSGELVLGRSAASLQSASLAELFTPESGAALLALLGSGFEGVSDSVVVLTDGRRVRFSFTALPEGRSLLIFRDATRFHRLEEELQKSRGLANIGNLAADLAYGISNPLAVIQGRIELLMANPNIDPGRLQRQLSILREHCQRIGGIIDNLQTIAAPQPPQLAVVLLNDVIDRARASLGRRLERVRIVVEVVPPRLQLQADPRQLEQALTNLLVQAVDDTPQGRLVSVTAALSGSEVRIAIEDEGRGLSPAQLKALDNAGADERAMPDPIVGLPLAITWVLVREHGGLLRAENRPHCGARYLLTFPISPVSQGSLSGDRVRSVLVVDDDQMLCETVRWMLSPEGFSIVAVHSAEEAIQRIARQQFDAVITDIRLPGIDGEELIDTIEVRWPRLARRAILISGLVYRPRRNNPYLKKPFTNTQLLQMLRTVCEPE